MCGHRFATCRSVARRGRAQDEKSGQTSITRSVRFKKRPKPHNRLGEVYPLRLAQVGSTIIDMGFPTSGRARLNQRWIPGQIL